jgi:hypothetical protein
MAYSVGASRRMVDGKEKMFHYIMHNGSVFLYPTANAVLTLVDARAVVGVLNANEEKSKRKTSQDSTS